jgi:hypothetical protein
VLRAEKRSGKEWPKARNQSYDRELHCQRCKILQRRD